MLVDLAAEATGAPLADPEPLDADLPARAEARGESLPAPRQHPAEVEEAGHAEAAAPAEALPDGSAPEPVAPDASVPEPVAPERLEALAARFTDKEFIAQPESMDALPLRRSVPDDLLGPLAERFGLKAEATRLRADLLRQGPSEQRERLDHALRSKAGALSGCTLWMLDDDLPAPCTPGTLDLLADAFDNAREATALLSDLRAADLHLRDRHLFKNVLYLAAEAQSAVRAAFHALSGRLSDQTPPHRYGEEPDQETLFGWLREVTETEQVHVSQYMKITQAAAPHRAADLAYRLRALRDEARLPDADTASAAPPFSQQSALRYHLDCALGKPWNEAYHWDRTVSLIAEALDDGVPPSNTTLRELLLPALPDLPEELPESIRPVLDEIDRYLDRKAQQEQPEVTPARQSADVQRLADLLRGRAVVLVGGTPSPTHHQAICEAFELDRLDWITTRAHQSTASFEPYVARPDVAVVIVAIRWSSHSFPDDMRLYCDKHDRLLVRHPYGLNPNQIAFQTLSQVGDRLADQ